MSVFQNRVDAGHQLAKRLDYLRGRDVVVLGLPRGGIPVAEIVANALGAPLDVVVVRKLRVPSQPEVAMGAIGEGGIRVLEPGVLTMARVNTTQLKRVERTETDELQRRIQHYRGTRPHPDLRGRTALIIDDGLATGCTARAACDVARAWGAARVIVATPVGPADIKDRLGEADDVVCLISPRHLTSVGSHYVEFDPTPDEAVVEALERSLQHRHEISDGDRPLHGEIHLSLDEATIIGAIRSPLRHKGIVLFAHGSGSSRHSPRNRYVASVLERQGFATLLLDLLTVEEEAERPNVFDIEMLTNRLFAATGWISSQALFERSPIGYFGASTGAAAALAAAARLGQQIGAVVSRGGRPDLAGEHLCDVTAPTLLIVGGADLAVAEFNKVAMEKMHAPTKLAIVPGATHLFEESGALEHVAALAGEWFGRNLGALTASAGHRGAR